MEIQWVMLALNYIEIEGFINILGVFHRLNLSKNDTYSFLLIAKVNVKPTEAFEKKRLIIYITRDDERIVGLEVLYTLPSLETWANFIPYISIPIRNMRFTSGEYKFRIIVDNEVKSQETIEAGYYGG